MKLTSGFRAGLVGGVSMMGLMAAPALAQSAPAQSAQAGQANTGIVGGSAALKIGGESPLRDQSAGVDPLTVVLVLYRFDLRWNVALCNPKNNFHLFLYLRHHCRVVL